MNNPVVVAHALGSINNLVYANCLESVLNNYSKGLRFFEVDLLLTSDDILVCHHSWLKDNFLYYGKTYYQQIFFKSFYTLMHAFSKILIEISHIYKKNKTKKLADFECYVYSNGLTPLKFSDLVELMEKFPDIHIITDTKSQNLEDYSVQFYEIEKAIKNRNDLKSRIIPQVYNLEMLFYLNNNYNYKEYILSLYKGFKLNVSMKNILLENKVTTIAFEKHVKLSTLRNYKDLGFKIALYTVNYFEELKSKIDILDFIYSDKIKL